MLVFLMVLSTLLINFIKCDLRLIDPIYPEFSKRDFNKTKMFSTSSPYTIQEECTPIRVWLLSRHGSKVPSEDILENIEEHLEKIIQPILKKLYGDRNNANFRKLKKNQQMYISRLLKWTNVLRSASHKELNERGKVSIMNLGKRLNAKLKEFTTTLKKDEIEVLSAIEDRCVISARKFIGTFFEGDADDIMIPVAKYEDQRLELVKPKSEDTKVNDSTKPGTLIDVEDLYFKLNCWKITKKIQLILFPQHIKDYVQNRHKVNDEIVRSMYYACVHGFYQYDASGNKTDAWCHLFDFDDLQMFENMFDLQYYNKNGYHLESNRMLGNALTEDLQLFLMEPKGIRFKFFLGHTSNILSLITRFNLFRDEPKLSIDNIEKRMHRKWKSSYIVPFGSNIMAVVYDCGFVDFRVTIYLNEVPIEMEILRNGGVFKCIKCPLKDIIDLINTFEVSKRPERLTTLEQDQIKRDGKEKKMKKKKLAREAEIVRKFHETLDIRAKKVYDEDETYEDEIEDKLK
ncbi:Histidine phosphatase superfamily,Histidine phosphatase superfamily, clade-2 [Cinara cedri]|uniref:Multiple inositol polyphosphate phosphatase 1 n=1 Tax=Cinara cedri TaxID=506608 RepID=A0A5E4N5G5_9HEMI|nr:Histidine phosphatase superfamily,Histidine phosphatase superfamily, clade-2 [Cinara cedri]